MGSCCDKSASQPATSDYSQLLSANSSPIPNSSSSSAKKIIYVYFHDVKQEVAFYQGTDSKQIEHLIKECFQLAQDLEIKFCDGNGTPLVLNTFIPNGAKIFMQRSKEHHQISNGNTNCNKNINIKSNASSMFDMSSDDDEEEDSDYGNNVPVVIADMFKWDKEMNLKGVITGNTWTAKGEWPHHCCTIAGITSVGGVFKYNIKFTSENDSFMYVYHQFGVMFRDELGSMKAHSVHISYLPMFRFMNDMNRNVGRFEVIIDVRTINDVNYSGHEKGVYFVLQPENRCLAFTSLFGKVPTVKQELLFAFWTKNKCSITIEEVNLVTKDYNMGRIKSRKEIENVAEKKHEHWEMAIKKLK